MSARNFLLFIIVVGVIAVFLYREYSQLTGTDLLATITTPALKPPPRTLIDDSVDETVSAAAEDGWVPCPGDCLKLTTPGWQYMQVAGHPDTDIWMKFKYSGGWQAYSQNHIGHIIETSSDSPAKDVGICPVCHGTGWVRKE